MKGPIQALFFVIILSFYLGCETAPKKSKPIESYIPENSVAIITIEDFEALQSDLNNNGIISALEKSSPYQFFKEKSFLQHLTPSSKSILCLTENDNKTALTFISKYDSQLFNTDSIAEISVENMGTSTLPIKKVSIDQQSLFTIVQDSVFIASTSMNILENSLQNNSNKDPIFNKIIALKNNQDVRVYIPAKDINTDEFSFNFASWAALDVAILPDGLTASGVVLANDSIPQLISVFKGMKPQTHDIASITPTHAKGLNSFTYTNFETLQNNLQHFRGSKSINEEETQLFESISEIGKISLADGNAIVLKSIDTELTNDALATFRSEKDTFKNVPIYSFSQPDLFSKHFLSLTENVQPNTVFNLGDFYILTENETVTQELINAFVNRTILSETPYYKDASSQLSDESSLQIIKLNGHYSHALSNLLKTELPEVSFKNYPIAILQFSYDRNFSHVNFVCQEATAIESKTKQQQVTQIASINLDHEIIGNPKFFSNHRTGGKDIVVQDINNTLYFISASGKTLWTKSLKSPILGEVKEVDILRNGKKQLAFATKNRVYVLDRTGRDVGKFPLKFRDDITQPLSVFDYDNNRKYRFMITQDNEVFMVDATGKRVKGFSFKKTQTKIVLPPQHIRVSGKDYILIAEKSGKLNILSRVGKHRMTISKTFDFSDIPIALEGNKFVVVTKDNTKHSISQNEKVSSLSLDVTAYWFTMNGKTKVTLDDNLMRINGKLVELPFGIYTAPKIFKIRNKTYVSITETQENKVYLYSILGKPIPGLPLFGTSPIDMGDARINGKTALLFKGAPKELVVYEID